MRIPVVSLASKVAVALTTGVLAAGALAGCGSSSSAVAQDPAANGGPTAPDSATPGTPTPGTQPADMPSCQKVWKAGSTLPAAYSGCHESAGLVKPQVYQCEDGHHVVTYAHLYYATPGRSISRAATTLAKDHGFRHVMATCGA
ncbi:MAG: hypothetical protein QM747_12575 [Nocardioides sp.]